MKRGLESDPYDLFSIGKLCKLWGIVKRLLTIINVVKLKV